LTPSSAPSLPALFHARSAHGVRPPEPSSSRAAVRRLRRLCLLDVQRLLEPTRKPAFRRGCRSAAPEPLASMMGRPAKPPRLQGVAPHESPPHRSGGLGRTEHVALLGFRPSRVFPLAGRTTTTGRVSPHEVTRMDDESTVRTPLQGLAFRRGWLASFETADPPGVSSPCDSPRKFGSMAVRESPPRAPGCVTAPWPSSP
jgi:hypothetical protein